MQTNSQLIALVAPGGYGKTYYIQNEFLTFWQKPTLHFSLPIQSCREFFEQFRQACQQSAIPYTEGQAVHDWLSCWNQQTTPFLIALENWHELEHFEEVRNFWDTILRHLPSQLTLILTSRKQINLPIAALCAMGKGTYLSEKELAFSKASTQNLWSENELQWLREDEVFFEDSQGWPIAIKLYLQFRQGHLNKITFEELLTQAVEDFFRPLLTLSPSPDLTPWHLAPQSWSKLCKTCLFKLHRPHPQIWLLKALQETPVNACVYLERAANLCSEQQQDILLTIYTRLIHNCSLLGKGEQLDGYLTLAQSIFDKGQPLDRAVYYYLKANRLRQKCQHQEAIETCQQLINLSATDPRVLDFQTRARIVWGLTAYQQGNYNITQTKYEEALLLARADQNVQLTLQIEIMLAFLAAFQGKNTSDSLPDNIQEIINQQPLSSQPLMWLNLAFYWILGEQMDLVKGKQIVEKVKANSQELKWPFLEPLVADVEARIWRYVKEYELAMSCHQDCLSRLEPDTFECLNASLNQALTLKKLNQDGSELEKLYLEAQEQGALSLTQEIQSIMQSDVSSVLVTETKVNSFEKPSIQVKMFGGLNVSIQEAAIEKWPRKKAKFILIQVLFHQRGIHRETLTDWLFPEADLEQGNRNLDVQLHSLRKLLEPNRKRGQDSSIIRFQDSCYSFNWEHSHYWDVKDFEQCYQLWKQEKDELTAFQLAQKCSELYQGPLLPELDFAENWIDIRENYHLKALEIIQYLLDFLYHKKDWESAENLAEKLLVWNDCNEEGYHWLLTLAGERQDRLRIEAVYQRMIRNFKKEMDSEPPEELLDLWQSLRA